MAPAARKAVDASTRRLRWIPALVGFDAAGAFDGEGLRQSRGVWLSATGGRTAIAGRAWPNESRK